MKFTPLSFLVALPAIAVPALLWGMQPAPSAHADSPHANVTVTTTEDELNADGDCSLREAIEAANRDEAVDGCLAQPGANTILLPAGAYTITLAGAGEDGNQKGDFDITGDVKIAGEGSAVTRILGANLDRLFHILPGARAELAGMTLRDGLTPIGAAGGAVLNEGTLVIDTSVIAASSSGKGQNCIGVPPPCSPLPGDGGGIFNSGVLTLTATIVQGNHTGTGGVDPNGGLGPSAVPDGAGGGVSNTGTLLVLGCEISGNQGDQGGGLHNAGRAVVVESAIYANWTPLLYTAWPSIFGSGFSSGSGGGIGNIGGSLHLIRSSVYDNVTPAGTAASGGGSHAVGGHGGNGAGILNTGVLTAANSTVAGNRTGSGGFGSWGGIGGSGAGILNQGALLLNNVTIAGNVAGIGGQGILVSGSDGFGGGVANAGTLRVKNTVLADNQARVEKVYTVSDCGGDPLTSHGFNLVTSAQCDGLDDPSDRLGAAARIGGPADFGGPTLSCAPLKFSPAIDGGSCEDSEQQTVSEDQRGLPRPQNGRCDAGAVELTPAELANALFLPFCAP